MAAERKEQDGARSFWTAPFPPLLGEITCFPVLWVPPPTAALPLPIVDPREGSPPSRFPRRFPLESPEARFCPSPLSRMSSSFFFALFLDVVLRASLGNPPVDPPLLSFLPGYADDTLGCLRSFVNIFSWAKSMGAVWMYSLYASEIGLKARDFLFRGYINFRDFTRDKKDWP